MFQLGHEFLDVFEIQVDRRKSNVSHFVEFFQTVHDQFADFAGLAFPLRRINEKCLRFIHDLLHLADRDWPFLAGAQQTVQHLLAVEFFPPAIFFDDHVRDFINALVSGKPLLAVYALSPATDGFALLALARIHYFIVDETAKRTFHWEKGESHCNSQKIELSRAIVNRRDSSTRFLHLSPVQMWVGLRWRPQRGYRKSRPVLLPPPALSVIHALAAPAAIPPAPPT